MSSKPKGSSPGSGKSPKPARRPANADVFRAIDQKLKHAQAGQAEPSVEATPTADSEAQQRFDELRDIAASFGGATDLRDILDRIVDGTLRVARCERGYVILVGSDGSWATYTGRRSDSREWDQESAHQISGGVVESVARHRRPLIVSDVRDIDDLNDRRSIQEGSIRAVVCMPLLHEDRLVGVIYADNSHVTPSYKESDRSVLQLFAVLAAMAVENGRRHGDLKQRGDSLEEQNLALARQLAHEFRMGGTVSKSKLMLAVFERVAKAAPADHIAVLIQGESGTGKERLARAIHDRSPRRERPFLAVNCAGMTTTLVEDALFGHSKGAFTGADSERAGIFEAASGGTVFLDEIGEMPLETQSKLLRVLEQREVMRLGENTVRAVDFRLVSATNLDLARAVAEDVFREDLYYRLKGTIIDVPPLRFRRDDIVPLAEHFLDLYADKSQKPRPQLSRDARAALLAHSWPGNVRELKTVVEVAILNQDHDHVIGAKAIEDEVHIGNRGGVTRDQFQGSLRVQLDQFEALVIRQVLAENQFSVAAASKVLDLSRQHLYSKLHKYGIPLQSD